MTSVGNSLFDELLIEMGKSGRGVAHLGGRGEEGMGCCSVEEV